MSERLVIVPTYNEIENIDRIIDVVLNLPVKTHLLIVDDNSPDGTGKRVKELQSTHNGALHLLERSGKLGLGTAYIAGFKWALERDYDYIFEMDADFSHNPKYIPEFLKEIKTHDLVIGSRYVPGGGVVNWGIIRKFISRGGSLYSRIVLGAPIRDFTGGFKCFKRKTLENLNLDKIVSNGYSFQVELNYKVWLKGMKIKETPIIFEDRTLGQSKMSKKIFLEAILKVLWMRAHKKFLKEN